MGYKSKEQNTTFSLLSVYSSGSARLDKRVSRFIGPNLLGTEFLLVNSFNSPVKKTVRNTPLPEQGEVETDPVAL